MINLYINYYKTDDKERQSEIDFCFDHNLNNPMINRMIVFSNETLADGVIHIKKDRPTYQDIFNEAAKYPDDINIICNSDIYFDETLKAVERIRQNQFYALTRWEQTETGIDSFFRVHHVKPEWSQDTWIFRDCGKIKGLDQVIATNLVTNKLETIPYTLGIPGCENHLAWLAKNRFGYHVTNPSLTIRTIHVHKERFRPDPKYRVRGSHGGGTWGNLMRVMQTL